MNNITIAGNITKDCEVRYSPNGDAIANFSVADNQGKDKPAIFWNCALFGKRATSLSEYLTKGQSVTVSGSVSQRDWTDKEGVARKSMDVRVTDVALQGGKKESSDAPAPKAQRQQPASNNDAAFPDEIPF